MTQHGDALFLARPSASDLELARLTTIAGDTGGTTQVVILGPAKDGASQALLIPASIPMALTVNLAAGESLVAVETPGLTLSLRGPKDASGWGPIVVPPGRKLAGYDVAVTAPAAGSYLVVVRNPNGLIGAFVRTHRFDAADRPRRFLLSKGQNLSVTPSYKVGIADIAGGGRPQLVVVGQTGGATPSCALLAYPANSDGTLGAAQVVPQAAGCLTTIGRRVAFSDVDEDGRTDVLYTTNTSAALMRADGSGGLGAPQAIQNTAGGWATLDVLDFDGDRHLDLALWTTGGIALFQGDGKGAFVGAGALGYLDGRLDRILTNDFDGDGKADVTAMNGRAPSGGFAFFSAGAGLPVRYALPATPIGNETLYAAGGPFLCDGRQQLAVTAGSTRVDFAELGSDGLLHVLDSAPLTGASNTLTQVEAVDVDVDGRTELAVLDGGGIGVFGRREVGWRMAKFAFPDGGNYNPVQMVITDFTGDGCPDVAIAASTNATPVLPGVCPR